MGIRAFMNGMLNPSANKISENRKIANAKILNILRYDPINLMICRASSGMNKFTNPYRNAPHPNKVIISRQS
ncbi:MAG: hypothetical protein DHS20C07_14850 [Methyloligella sp.]|nr:MAG: hypothetical protein DHS20C07_14850 [Methyloligella sp.]